MDSAPPIYGHLTYGWLIHFVYFCLSIAFYSPYRVVNNDTDAHNECVSNVDYLDGKQVWIAGSNSWSKDVNILFKYTSGDKD